MATSRVAWSLLSGSITTSRNIVSASDRTGVQFVGGTSHRWTEVTKWNNRRGKVMKLSGSQNVLRRPVPQRAAPEQLTATDSLNSQREILKQKLMQLIVAESGNLNDECLATIKELEKFNPNPEALSDPELYAGYWERLKAGQLGTGRKGESKVEVGYEGASVTLGRATFSSFKPADLEIVMGEVYTHVPVLGVKGEKKYAILIEFTTKNPKGDDLPLIQGLIINGASVNKDSPSRLGVFFDEIKIRPCYPERDLEAWKEIFEEASGGTMDEAGEITVINKNALPGFLDITYIDQELRVSRGNLGAYVVVRRMDEPPRFVK